MCNDLSQDHQTLITLDEVKVNNLFVNIDSKARLEQYLKKKAAQKERSSFSKSTKRWWEFWK